MPGGLFAGRVGPRCRVRIPGLLSCLWQLTLDAVGKWSSYHFPGSLNPLCFMVLG